MKTAFNAEHAEKKKSRGGAAAARPAHTRKAAGSNPAPASISGILRPGDLLRSGRIRIAKFAAHLEVWDGERLVVQLYPFVGGVKFSALPDREEGTYPEFHRAGAVAAIPSSSLKPQASGLPLVRQGQGDYTRDLSEEDVR